MPAQFGKHRRENHAGGNSQTRQRHLGPHRQCHLTPLEPFDDAAGNRDTRHFHTATEYHETHSRKLGGGRHAAVERGNPQFIETGNVVQVVVEPRFQSAPLKSGRHRIPVQAGTHQHHHAGKNGSETYPHLVQDDTCENQEKDEDIQKGLRPLHRPERRRIPAAGGLHQVFDG